MKVVESTYYVLLKRMFKIKFNIPKQELLRNTIGPLDEYLRTKFYLIANKAERPNNAEYALKKLSLSKTNFRVKKLLDLGLWNTLHFKCGCLIPKYRFIKNQKVKTSCLCGTRGPVDQVHVLNCQVLLSLAKQKTPNLEWGDLEKTLKLNVRDLVYKEREAIAIESLLSTIKDFVSKHNDQKLRKDTQPANHPD